MFNILVLINQAGGLYGRILFEAGHLLTFTAFRMGAYTRWVLINNNNNNNNNNNHNICDLCDAEYVGYTSRHLYKRIEEHRFTAIGKHFKMNTELIQLVT